MNIGESHQSRPAKIKLGPDGELEEAMPVPEIGTYRRSRLRRLAGAIFARREPPPSPDAETLNRFLTLGLTTHPTVCKHCGAHWPVGSKQYCVACGYPLPIKQYNPIRDNLVQVVWSILYIAGIGGVAITMFGMVLGILSFNVFSVIALVCGGVAFIAQGAGGFDGERH